MSLYMDFNRIFLMYVYVVLPIIFNFTKLKFTLSNLPRITISKNPDQIKNNPHKFPIY